MRICGKKPLSFLLRCMVYISVAITVAVLGFLVSYILIKGVPHLSPKLFAWTYTSENCSMVPAIINTLVVIFLALLIAMPAGIGAAIYLVEYAKRGNKLVNIVRLTAETLTGIPSIVYGLFGMLLFVNKLKWFLSIRAGALTLAIMVLPIIMRTTEEALLAVPDSYREGSFGLGAGKLRTVFKIILPSAVPGILSGVILSIGRIVGETAALLYTAGSVAGLAGGSAGTGGLLGNMVKGSGRTLAIHMYCLSSEGFHINEAYATAVVLLVIVILMNLLSGQIAKRVTKG